MHLLGVISVTVSVITVGMGVAIGEAWMKDAIVVVVVGSCSLDEGVIEEGKPPVTATDVPTMIINNWSKYL